MLDNFIKHQTLISEECSSAELKCIFRDICVVNGILVSLYKKILMEAIWIKGYVWKLLIVGDIIYTNMVDVFIFTKMETYYYYCLYERISPSPIRKALWSIHGPNHLHLLWQIFVKIYRALPYIREHFVVGISLLRYCYIGEHP